jgi:hypothetical protein
MGTVIRFPDAWRPAHNEKIGGKRSESASIIILPVIRIERQFDGPSGELDPGTSRSGRRRRRRATRS